MKVKVPIWPGLDSKVEEKDLGSQLLIYNNCDDVLSNFFVLALIINLVRKVYLPSNVKLK